MSSNRHPTGKPGGQPAIPLILTVPGGHARFYSQDELTPRRTRALDVQIAHLGPRMHQLAVASQVTGPGGAADTSTVLTGPSASITEEEADKFAALNDLAVWVYLKSWTVGRDLPATPDDVLDLPTPLYQVLVDHAAKLVAASVAGDTFTVEGLPDDDAEVDLDLPTSA